MYLRTFNFCHAVFTWVRTQKFGTDHEKSPDCLIGKEE